MTKFCATGDSIIVVPLPEEHAGTDKIAEYIKSADVRITNLETTVSNYEYYASSFSGGDPLTIPPSLLNDLKRYGFNACGTANNHSMDFSFEGILSTIRHLDEAGWLHAGTGKSLQDASAPATIPTKEGTVAYLAMTSVYYGNDSGRAGDSHDGIPARPGVNGLRRTDECLITREQMEFIRDLAAKTMVNAEEELEQVFGYSSADTDPDRFSFGTVNFRVADKPGKVSSCNETDMQRMERAIRNAKMTHRYVVVSIHCHQFPRRVEHEVDYYLEEFAHRCIDAGADAIIGHGNHLLKGIEIYKDCPIFYCLGNFIFHPEYVSRIPADVVEFFGFSQELTGLEITEQRKARATCSMESNPLCYQSVVPLWEMDGEKLSSITLLPVELGMQEDKGLRGFPSPADPQLVIDHLRMVCEPFGTKLEIDGGYIKVILD